MELFRIMGIDYGIKRIGIALSDPLLQIAQPFAVLANGSGLWSELRELASQNKVKEAVIGLPLNFAGEDTRQTRKVRQFAEDFARETGIIWHFQEESFTSEDANDFLKQQGYSIQESRRVIDKVAAALILQNYLSEKK